MVDEKSDLVAQAFYRFAQKGHPKLSIPTTLNEAIKRVAKQRPSGEPSATGDRDEPDDAPEESQEGGRLDEAQSLAYWWMLSPEDACEVVGFPVNQYHPWDEDRGEPPYLPSPNEIERLSQRMRSGKLVIGGTSKKQFVLEEIEPDDDELEDWPRRRRQSVWR